MTQITMDIDTAVQRAQTQMILHLPFFSSLALNLPLKESPKVGDKYIVDTMCTDGKQILYNPMFIQTIITKAKEGSQNGSNVKPVIGVLIHEIMHIALGHPWRKEHRIHKIWNRACDYVINDMIMKIDKAELPEGVLYDKDFEGLCEEEVYHKLKDKVTFCSGECGSCQHGQGQQQQGQGQSQCPGGGGQGQGDGEEEDDQDGSGGGQGQQQGKGQGGQQQQKGNCPAEQAWGDHSHWGDHEKEYPEMKDKSKQMLAQAAQIAKMQGKLPSYLERLVDELLNPQVDWRTALSNFIQPSKVDYDFCPADRRFEDMIIPDISGEAVEDLLIAVDTSGSIGHKELTTFLSESMAILGQWPTMHGWITACDAAVHEWYDFDSEYNINNSLGGGGGTDFRPVFDEIEERGITPCAVIFFTDLYGEFPQEPPNYPVLWLAIDSEHEDAPFGVTIRISSDSM